MNMAFAQRAVDALHGPGYEDSPGYCLRWVRQVFEVQYGVKAWKVPAGDDAKSAFEWLCKDGTIEPSTSLGTIGDILFFTGRGHGPHGHVAIRIAGNKVAENSIIHHPDGRGTRPLWQLGTPAGVWDVSGLPFWGDIVRRGL